MDKHEFIKKMEERLQELTDEFGITEEQFQESVDENMMIMWAKGVVEFDGVSEDGLLTYRMTEFGRGFLEGIASAGGFESFGAMVNTVMDDPTADDFFKGFYNGEAFF